MTTTTQDLISETDIIDAIIDGAWVWVADQHWDVIAREGDGRDAVITIRLRRYFPGRGHPDHRVTRTLTAGRLVDLGVEVAYLHW